MEADQNMKADVPGPYSLHNEITARDQSAQVTTQLPVPIDVSQPYRINSLKTCIRSEALRREFHLQIVFDTRPQIRFLSSHFKRSFVFGLKGRFDTSKFTETESLFLLKIMVLFTSRLRSQYTEILLPHLPIKADLLDAYTGSRRLWHTPQITIGGMK